MDPCPFIRLIVESLALKLPPVSKTGGGTGVHPSTTPCFCTLQLQDLPSSPIHTAPLPLASSTSGPVTALPESPDSNASLPSPPVIFTLDMNRPKRLSLLVSVYAGRRGSTCGLSARRLMGRVRVGADVGTAGERTMVMQSGWVSLGRSAAAARLHLVVRSERDPRYVFQFGGEPECCPVVYQLQGVSGSGGGGGGGSMIRQPVFSCRFSADRRRNTRSRSLPSESSRNSSIKGWLTSFGSQKDPLQKDQRKGWTVTIHDLSGSPVAAASMITPFVPSPGSDRVSRSNPGAWLILRATGLSTSDWKPWGRLEAWRERGPADALGYKFELVTDSAPDNSALIAESSVSVRRGGVFKIDPSGPVMRSRGFVMESTVEGEGKVSKPSVQVGVQHVSCMGDVALFIALSAAVDLSMDACQLFSQRLRKELCFEQQEYVSI